MKIISKIIFGTTIGLVLSMFSFYLFQAGQIVEASYLIETSQIEIEKISVDNIDLQTTASNVSGFGSLEEQISMLDFIQVSSVKYIPMVSERLSLSASQGR